MARGKYAAKSEHRRTLAENEERADVAERAQSAAERELAEYRATAEAKIARLEARLADVTEQRDAVSSPRVAELEARNAELSAVVRDGADDLRKRKERQDRLFRFTAALLHNMTGCTGLEATEAIVSQLGLDGTVTYEVATPERLSADEVSTLQRVRGVRSNQKITEHLNSLVEAAKQYRPGHRWNAS